MEIKSKLFYGYVIALIIYSLFLLLPKPLQATLIQYHLSVLGVRLIYVTVILILIVIWFAGLYGYMKIKSYAELIEGDKDGKQISKLSKGIFLLVIWQPVSTVVSIVLKHYSLRHHDLVPAVTILDNYLSLIFPFVGFIYIGMAARGLSDLVRKRPNYFVNNLLILFIIYIGIIYFRLVATTTNRSAIYHMSIWLILTTLIAPYVFMWSVGLRATYEIYIYRQKVKGLVYRQSWRYLAVGIAWLIVTSIIFQYVSTLGARLDHLSIYWLLIIIYSLLVILSAGFILIAIGARKLKKIEEV